MSRQLPARPNLEHLKHQAKDLLEELVRRDPSAKLADALHTIAREYGFASWPKLKAHVVAASASASGVSPFVGRWVANFSKSKRHSLDDARSATLQFIVAGDTITVLDSVVDARGQERRGENVLVADGDGYVSEQGAGYSVCTCWRGDRRLVVATAKEGKDLGHVTYTVSDDGHLMTVAAAVDAHDGYPAADHLLVFERAATVG